MDSILHLPYVIIRGMWNIADGIEPRFTTNYLFALLFVLLFLHIYWYCMFLYIGYMFSRTGITQDLQQRPENEKTDYEIAELH